MENPLELKVVKSVVGTLETNIASLEKYVNSKLEEYKPELYIGDSVMAKKDRAELNNSKKVLTNARISLMKELMKPYEDFEDRCKNLEKKIDNASKALDEIVKAKENEEKEQKKNLIAEMWVKKDFNLVSLDKVFNQKWLNKTTKENEIDSEMDSIIQKIYSDLKSIEKFSVDNVETLKAHYLISLDIAETLDYGNELEKKIKLADEELNNRAGREHQEKIEVQKKEVIKEALNINIEKMAQQSLGMTSELVKEFVVSVKATDEQLLRLKSACNALGLEYSVEELTF
jgi:hypothetical protein